ncbi:MAG: hypothetical protein U0Q15_11285 [Kineosporiaceae bacterium]
MIGRRERWRWLAPIAALALVACVLGVNRAVQPRVAAAVSAPGLDASGVLWRLLHPDDDTWSGQVDTHVELGLPAGLSRLWGATVPDVGSPLVAASSPSGAESDVEGVPLAATPAGVLGALLSSDTSSRVWVAGRDRIRAQILQPLGEVDVVGDGRSWWTYSARHDTALRILGASGAATPTGPAGAMLGVGSGLDFAALTPQGLATALLADAAKSGVVRLGPGQMVDGRAAHTLRVAPRQSTTLLQRVEVAVDAVSGLALRVQVFTTGRSQPVLETTLSRLDLARPADQRFAFTPARSTSVHTWTSAGSTSGAVMPVSQGTSRTRLALPSWDAVVRLDADAAGNPLLAWHGVSWRRVAALGSPSADGSRVLRTPALTLLVTEDERVYAGAVPEAALTARAAADARTADAEAVAQEYVPPPAGSDR